jgi:hypothetical protein
MLTLAQIQKPGFSDPTGALRGKTGFSKEHFMDILLTIHSFLPLLIVTVAVLAIFKFAIGWLMNSSFKGLDRGLASGFSGLMDLQILLGLIFFLWNGFTVTGFPGYRWLHMGIMSAAAVLGHLPSRLKMLGDKPRFAASLGAILGALALVFVGVAVLAGR